MHVSLSGETAEQQSRGGLCEELAQGRVVTSKSLSMDWELSAFLAFPLDLPGGFLRDESSCSRAPVGRATPGDESERVGGFPCLI